ncbi:hypothetical protein JOS77_18735 [Chromobacterium haemolyticum]|nr:hypothetical protein JOS77_18735 [Chromobacterium haemolyticum]
MRRDFNSRDNEASSPAGGDSPAGKSPVIQKKAPSADASPRAPYSGPRPGNAKPNWQDCGAGQGQARETAASAAPTKDATNKPGATSRMATNAARKASSALNATKAKIISSRTASIKSAATTGNRAASPVTVKNARKAAAPRSPSITAKTASRAITAATEAHPAANR